MISMHTTTSFLSLLGVVSATALALPMNAQDAPHLPRTTIVTETPVSATSAPRPAMAGSVVEIAICLDTSGSMDGLIDAAKQKLWSIVNDLALADPAPVLRVALLTYGNDGHAEENGWVKVETTFTDDLDMVSQKLFALTTNGGTELVGRVIQTASQELVWTPSEDALKIVIVAGNESADQDQQANFREVCKAAIGNGIMVNSIYCVYHGDNATIADGWRDVARLADGQYATIDQNNTAVVIATPYDDELIRLSTQINATYIPFGEYGEIGCANQWAQDDNAMQLNKGVAASRATTKGGALYNNATWDLCDAVRTQNVNIRDVKEEDLPENMRSMTMDERIAYIESMQTKRNQVQAEIDALNVERQKLLTIEASRQAASGQNQFDLIIRSAIRDQARSRGFNFKTIENVGFQPGQSLPYFVRIADVWVAADLAHAYETALAAAAVSDFGPVHEEGSDAYNAVLASLDEPTRAAVESIDDARVIVRLPDGSTSQLLMKPAPVTEGEAAGTAINLAPVQTQTLQTSQGQVQQIIVPSNLQPQQIRIPSPPPAPTPPVDNPQQEEGPQQDDIDDGIC